MILTLTLQRKDIYVLDNSVSFVFTETIIDLPQYPKDDSHSSFSGAGSLSALPPDVLSLRWWVESGDVYFREVTLMLLAETPLMIGETLRDWTTRILQL